MSPGPDENRGRRGSPEGRPLLLDDLDYELPAELIAQRPAERREDARLLVVERATGRLHDARFTDLPSWLEHGDTLAINETRVRPARLVTRRETGGRVTLLFVRPADRGEDEVWIALAQPARGAGVGTTLETEDRQLALEVVAAGSEGERTVRVARGDLQRALRTLGQVPLPPYLRRAPEEADRERYQTVFARVEGAVAAPTAGLHFSDALLRAVESRGVDCVRVLLHVGPGTFRPVKARDPRAHRMDEEYFEVSDEAAARLRASRELGRRVVAVGTTVARALEAACDANEGRLGGAAGWTAKYILPPYRFQAVDALVTNFHLPRTTLLLLVAALAGEEIVRRAYRHAVQGRYRFYSYGDAMLVV